MSMLETPTEVTMATARVTPGMDPAVAETSMRASRITAASGPPPQIELDWETLERQDRHLWMLAVALMVVLGISLLTFMFPTVFWFSNELPVSAPDRAFFGLVILVGLALVYMLQRHATLRGLKRRLHRVEEAAAEADRRANRQAFDSLPDINQFRDSLAMEYLRSTSSHGSLAIMLSDFTNASPEDLGRLSKALRRMLRSGESLFRLGKNSLGLILPGMSREKARAFRAVAEGSIGEVSPSAHTVLDIAVYPDDVSSLAEFESLLRATVG